MTANPNMNGPTRIQGLTKANARQLVQLVEMVAEEAGLESRAIYGPDQDQYAVAFRRALWWCFRECYLMTYENISRIFKSANGGHFNYSSVMAGCNKVRTEGLMIWSDRKSTWVERGTGIPSPEPRLREALQIVAAVWNELNPQNPLQSWTNSH